VPIVGAGHPAALSPGEFAAVEQALGTTPQKPDTLNIVFDGGSLPSTEMITQASPPLVDATHPQWKAQDVLIDVRDIVFDQEADDEARNGLFVVAILLSTAAAALVSAMQLIVRHNGKYQRAGTEAS
jgi:hypothetical protein